MCDLIQAEPISTLDLNALPLLWKQTRTEGLAMLIEERWKRGGNPWLLKPAIWSISAAIVSIYTFKTSF